MAQKVIKTTFMLRRDTAANWITNKDVIPSPGEPCFDLTNGILKIGDGTTTYENLPAINAEITADEKSITFADGILELVGFAGAEAGAQLVKGEDGKVSWVVPSTDTVDGLQTTVGNLDKRITTNENAIATLNGTGEGSVTKTVDEALNKFATDVSNDEIVNTYKELVDYVAEHAPEAATMAGDISTLKEDSAKAKEDITKLNGLVGDESVATQISTAIGNIDLGDHNVIESVSINNEALEVINKNVNIPIATSSALGVVKGSAEVSIGTDGKLVIETISFDKIVEGTDIIFFDGGGSTTVITLE